MKFEHVLNPFNPTVTVIDLSLTELEYITMIFSSVDRNKIKKLLSITEADIEELYKKFGLIDDRFNLEEQMKAVAGFSDMISESFLYEVYKKYNLVECKKFIEQKRSAPKYSEKQKREEFEALKSFMQSQ